MKISSVLGLWLIAKATAQDDPPLPVVTSLVLDDPPPLPPPLPVVTSVELDDPPPPPPGIPEVTSVELDDPPPPPPGIPIVTSVNLDDRPPPPGLVDENPFSPCALIDCAQETPICIDPEGICVEDVCAGVTCEGPNEICRPQIVQCVTTPCPPIPQCFNPCATILCLVGNTCEVVNGQAQCVPIMPPTITCANVLCAPGFPRCIETPQGPRCIPPDTCAEVECEPGTSCAVKNGVAQCFPNGPYEPPEWVDEVDDMEDYKPCARRKGVAPFTGTSCSRKPKVCYFGTQNCNGQPYPAEECACPGAPDRVWLCNQAMCPPSIAPVLPIAPNPICPPPGIGICISECSGDDSCTGGQKCCSNGCGQVCTDPIVPTPGESCPPAGIGICVELCSGDDSCTGGQKCCSNGCGHVCTDPV